MNETKSTGVGLIGYGFAGKTFHAPLIRAVEGLTLTGIASSDAAKVRKDFPGMQVFQSPDALIAEPSIELIVIATPNDSHAPLARAALASIISVNGSARARDAYAFVLANTSGMDANYSKFPVFAIVPTQNPKAASAERQRQAERAGNP